MKRCKMAFILGVLICLLCGCGNKYESSVKVNQPTDTTVNGYRTEDSQTALDIVYYANENSKKFHIKGCQNAERISKENLYITKDRNYLITIGNIPCEICNP